MREAHMKTCPDCNGDGVVEKRTDDERNAQRAVAVVSYVTTTAMKK
jgi:DnaJ-class molecular chaperone